MYSVARSVEGISLNGDEYLLNDDGSLKLFRTAKLARRYLRNNGIPKAEIDTYRIQKEPRKYKY